MIISRTPFRISFFGGGTDYPAWYRENGGSVISTTIDKYCYISCRYLPPFFEHKHRIVYSQIENVRELHEIKHPAVKAVMGYMKVTRGLEIHHDGDLPARSGLGSSSAFTVGLLNALGAFRGERISKEELAKTAIHVEQEIIKETVGSQDQISASFGGFNRIEFKRDDTFSVSPVIMSRERREEFEKSLMLFYTGIVRVSETIQKTKIDHFKKRGSELTSMQELVKEAAAVFSSKSTPIDEIGKLMHKSWELKRTLSSTVSNPQIDQIYQAAMDAGASGGKILGAGGGGFILFSVKPEMQAKVRETLKSLLFVSFQFDDTGSSIVLYDPKLAI